MNALSAVLVAAELSTGAHRIEFRRLCSVAAERSVNITQLQDVVLDPVKLESAVGTVVATSTQPNTVVFVDGQERGPAPFTGQLCEGEHVVEMRSAFGRYARRVDTRAGQRSEVTGAMRPAFAIVSATVQTGVSTDLRSAIERALEPVRSVSLFAPPADRVDQALRGSRLTADWLSFDNNKRAIGSTADLSAPRAAISTRLARTFDAQGSHRSPCRPRSIGPADVSLLSARAAPIRTCETQSRSIRTTLMPSALLDRPVQFLRPSIRLTTDRRR